MNESKDEEEKNNYECLVARAASYEKSVSTEQNQSTPVLAKSNRGKMFFHCKNRYDLAKKLIWVPSNSSSCQFCVKYET